MSSQAQTAQNMPPAAQVLQLASGYWISRALQVAIELRIADLLKDGPKSAAELAAATNTNADALYRILRALSTVDLFVEGEGRQFSLTPLSEALRSDAPDSIYGMARFIVNDLHWDIYRELFHCARTGEPAFDRAFGQKPFEYLSQHPDQARIFDDAMTSFSATTSYAIAEAYDFSAFKTIVDVAGGNGALLAAILDRHPQPRGLLFDLPHVIERAGQKALLPPTRTTLVAGDFFQSIPEGADAYMFKHIIHDWDDPQARTILEVCRRATKPSSKLLIAEMTVPPPNEPAYVKLLDLEMMAIPGGRERTEDEFRVLLASAGFRLTRVLPTHSPVSIIEAVPV